MKSLNSFFALLLSIFVCTSCSQQLGTADAQGYLVLKLNTLVSTTTRADAPNNYNGKTIAIDIQDASGNVVKTIENAPTNDPNYKIALQPGSYIVVAHSQGWDGNGSGFDAPYYYGSTNVSIEPNSMVTARITCTQANVKVTVNFDSTFASNFAQANVKVASSVAGISPLNFQMGETLRSGYFPAGDLNVNLAVTNHNGVMNSLDKVFQNAQAREHYILNFKMVPEGQLGDGTESAIKVEVDESTNTYTYTFEVSPKAATALMARPANAWSTFAYLNGAITSKTSAFNSDNLCIQWKETNAATWNEMKDTEFVIDDKDNISAHLKGLSPNTIYEYRLFYKEGDNEVKSETISFTTEDQIALYNGGFEYWITKDRAVYPTQEGISFWDTSNPGSKIVNVTVTNSTTEKKVEGMYAAKLVSNVIMKKLAAASMYTGAFVKLVSTKGAILNWGTPFVVRPTALKGYIQYSPSAINIGGSNLPEGAPAQGALDQCGIFCALLSEQLTVDNTKIAETFPNWQTDPRVIAYGEYPATANMSTNGEWKEVNIPLEYHSLTVKPTHLLVVFSSSKYGDYFHGGEGSTLYLDDFKLVYGDTPTVQQ